MNAAMEGLKNLRNRHGDWLLTLLTALVILMMFVFAPLQAAGHLVFQGLAVGGLLAIIGGMLIISASRHSPDVDVDRSRCQRVRFLLAAKSTTLAS